MLNNIQLIRIDVLKSDGFSKKYGPRLTSSRLSIRSEIKPIPLETLDFTFLVFFQSLLRMSPNYEILSPSIISF